MNARLDIKAKRAMTLFSKDEGILLYLSARKPVLTAETHVLFLNVLSSCILSLSETTYETYLCNIIN